MATIELAHGRIAQMDDADLPSVLAAGKWHSRHHRYTFYIFRNTRSPDGRRGHQSLHTFLTGWELVDHRNGDGLDNRRENLRRATSALNAINKRVSKNSETGFKGVTLHKPTGRWYARISILGRTRHLGAFATAEAAARRHDDVARDTYGEFACLNFPRNGERGARADVLEGRT